MKANLKDVVKLIGSIGGSSSVTGRAAEMIKVDPTLTKSGYAAEAKTVGDKLAEMDGAKLGKVDVINHLLSTATDKPLSAAMGKHLNDRINQAGGSAENVIYDGSESNLDAHDVQYAITLLASMVRGCLPLEGGTLTGENLYMDGGNARIQGNENALWLQALNAAMDNNNRRLIALYNSQYKNNPSQALMFEDIQNGSKQSYTIYGEHNKRTGTYIGDDYAGTRIVTTGSVGKVALLFGKLSNVGGLIAAIVCPMGAIYVTGENECGVVSNDAIYFNVGVINISRAGNIFNTAGKTYTYYVL